MRQFYVISVIGTRPEALKMLPIIERLEENDQFNVKTIVTGQHRELLSQMLGGANIAVDVNFDVMEPNQSLNVLSSKLFHAFDHYLSKKTCDLLIAQGDTTTTLTAALSAFYKKIPFAHIEAGLRTSSIHSPFPEEFNRRTISMVSTLHFCPTEQSAKNLQKEGTMTNVFVTGNTIIDTLYKYSQSIEPAPDSIRRILVTCHRRENFGDPMLNICNALKIIAKQNPDIEILFLVHPNPNVKQVVRKQLGSVDNIVLSDPLNYPQLIRVMKYAYLVLTDSGGLQEEAPALGKPVLVLRDETERPEGLQCGASILVGSDIGKIIQQTERLLKNHECYIRMSQAGSPYGDGLAAQRILQAIVDYFLK